MRKISLLGCVAVCALAGKGDAFPESVDVLVAGGTVSAVETACAAKKAGKSVLIVSPRPYFGEETAGRFELEPIFVEDEPFPVEAPFKFSSDGKKARASVSFVEPAEVTRIEIVTEERTWQGKASRTKECHYICRGPDEKSFSPVRQLDVVMCYSPGGRYVWRAEVNRRIKELAVGATRDDRAQDLRIVEFRVFRKAAPGTKRRPTPLEAKSALDARLTDAKVPFVTGGMPVDVLTDASGRVAGAVFATRAGLRSVRAGLTVDASVHGVLLKAAGGTLEPLPKRVRLSRVVLSGEKPSAPGLSVEELPQGQDGIIQLRGKKWETVKGRLYRCSFDWVVDDSPLGWAAADMKARDLTWTKSQLDAADELTVPTRTCAKTVPGLVYLPTSSPARQSSTVDFQFSTPNPQPTPLNSQLPTRNLHPSPFNLQLSTFNLSSDVCVVGAGTAGAPATIAAVRAGAKTVAVEYMYGLGGLGTMGMIGYYWYGTVCGFTKEVETGIAALGAMVPGVGKREWWRREAAGATVLFGSMAYGVVREGNTVVGVKVATPFGPGIVRAKVSVDATGAADLAAAAGERTDYIGADELAMQSAGLPPRVPGFTYVNSDFGYVNDNDPADTTLFGLRGRRGAKGEWDVAQIVGSRERRRLVGGFQVQPEDVLNERTFPDTIATGSTDFDTHGPTVADVCFLSPATDKHVFKLNIPYRALLPAKTDGLLVCGIGASAQRDAQPFMRMQADVQNEGYAAGRAAAMAAKGGVSPRRIDVKELQRHLAGIGSIPQEALDWTDNFPLSDADWQTAVAAVGDGFKGAPLVLTDKPRARRDLHAAFLRETDPMRRVAFAQVLGMLGDDVGADVLVEHLSQKDYQPVVSDKAKRFGKRMGGRDAEIVALGRTRSPKAVSVVRREIERLPGSAGGSHVRALALASLALRDASLAPALANALKAKRLGGHARAEASALSPLGGFTRTAGGFERMACVRELLLARALLACGDSEGFGRRTLEAYARDPRGVYAAHARAVLAQEIYR